MLEALDRSGVLRLSAWDGEGRLVYSTDPDLVALPPQPGG